MGELKSLNSALEDKVEKKSVEVNLLRNSLDKEDVVREGELLYSFSDSHYEPSVEGDRALSSSFDPISFPLIVLYSLIPSLIYIFICIIVRKLSKRR